VTKKLTFRQRSLSAYGRLETGSAFAWSGAFLVQQNGDAKKALKQIQEWVACENGAIEILKRIIEEDKEKEVRDDCKGVAGSSEKCSV
jgi:hypothetical protein